MRILLLLVLLAALLMPNSAQAQWEMIHDCLQGTWKLNPGETFSAENIRRLFPDIPAGEFDWTLATGAVYLSFDEVENMVYTFDNWSITFRGTLGGDQPTTADATLTMNGEVWAFYSFPEDPRTFFGTLYVGFLSGDSSPVPPIESTLAIGVPGMGVIADGPFDVAGIFDEYQDHSIDVNCGEESLFVQVRGGEGSLLFNDARYDRVVPD